MIDTSPRFSVARMSGNTMMNILDHGMNRFCFQGAFVIGALFMVAGCTPNNGSDGKGKSDPKTGLVNSQRTNLVLK